MNETEQIVDEILKCSEESSKQEFERSQILLKKSDYLMKYISASFVIANAVSGFAVARNFVPDGIVCIYYLIVGILLLIGMTSAIKAQTLLEVNFFPTGMQILEGMVKKKVDEDKVYSLQDIKIDSIKYYSKYTDSLKTANDERAKIIKQGYRSFTYATIGLAVGFFVFLVLIA